MNNREAMQKAFEANYKPHEKDFSVFDVDDCKDYTNPNTEKAYAGFVIGYQAALASQAQQEPDKNLQNKSKEYLISKIVMLQNASKADDRAIKASDILIESLKVKIAVLESQAQQTESQWISVDERLPEMETPVVALVGKNVYALARVDYDEGWLWAICGCDLSDIRDYEADDDYQPTHWMYLSIPPAPDGGDK